MSQNPKTKPIKPLSPPWTSRITLCAGIALSLAASLTTPKLAHALPGLSQLPPLSIYGDDNRTELVNFLNSHHATNSESTAAIERATHATAALFSLNHINPPRGPLWRFRRAQLTGRTQRLRDLTQSGLPLCQNTRFLEQRLGPSCSGVLIDRKHVLTAAHCITYLECKNMAVGFGFTLDHENLRGRDLYACKNVRVDPDHDLALIELDRRVRRVQPIQIPSSSSEQGVGDALVLSGFPLGLPHKVSHDAQVLAMTQDRSFFYVNADAFMGNSGGPLIDPVTGTLQGLLSSGPSDFEEDEENHCMREAHSPQTPSSSINAERAISLQSVLNFL